MFDLRQAKTTHSQVLKTSETALNSTNTGCKDSQSDETMKQGTADNSNKCYKVLELLGK